MSYLRRRNRRQFLKKVKTMSATINLLFKTGILFNLAIPLTINKLKPINKFKSHFMKQILLLLSFFLSFTLSAQVSLAVTVPDGSVTALSTEDDVTAKGTIKNIGDTTVTVKWKRNVIALTDGWETAVCDKFLCYLPNIEETPDADFYLVLEPGGESNFDVHVYPFGMEGAAIVEVTATDVNNPENTITGRYEFNQNTTSTTTVYKPEIKIYPNPTVNFISLTDSDYVERLVIYNIVGRPVKIFNANYSNLYNVIDLPTGMYLVRLMDENDKTIKTVRLSKKSGA